MAAEADMSTPDGYPSSLVAGLWGGVASDTSGVDFTADCQAAQASAQDTENQRRRVASMSPGLGAAVQLPDVPYGPGVGIWDVPGLAPVGESHQTIAPVSEAVHKSYGAPRPQYGADLLGGLGYAPGAIARPALRSSLYDLADAAFASQDRAAAGPGDYAVFSPPVVKPGLLARLAARLRRR
jgi:hypothetical protein